MQDHRPRLIAVALVAASVAIAAPAVGAKQAVARAVPELTVTKVTISRPYVVVAPNGKALSFGVSVSLKNAGHGAAPASTTTILVIQDGSPIARDKVRAGPLAPGHATTQIAIFRDVEAGLGFLHAEGVAEGRLHPTPSSPVPVIAQRWRADQMEADVHTPGLGFGGTEDELTSAGIGLVFKFSHLDAGLKRFVYTASGPVGDMATISGQCTGSGDSSATKPRWGGDSGLYISKSLTKYEAQVRASLAKPFVIGVTCTDIPATLPMTVRFHDLLTTISTHGAPLPMSPTAHHLLDHASMGTISIVRYGWDLAADVP